MGIPPVYANIFSSVKNLSMYSVKNTSSPMSVTNALAWLHDPTLIAAVNELNNIAFDKSDIAYLQNMGAYAPYSSGSEAVNFIKDANLRITFAPMQSKHTHAQYEYDKNTIMINDIYRGATDFPVILAIAEAILHEAGHAKDYDGDSSIQEELDFLGMNAIAHRAFTKKYGDIFKGYDELIVKDGVSIYEKLFFAPNPEKDALVKRVRTKYGYLPAGDHLHPPGNLALIIKNN